jgi:hypothetical protein
MQPFWINLEGQQVAGPKFPASLVDPLMRWEAQKVAQTGLIRLLVGDDALLAEFACTKAQVRLAVAAWEFGLPRPISLETEVRFLSLPRTYPPEAVILEDLVTPKPPLGVLQWKGGY